jgi:hypothetical protein
VGVSSGRFPENLRNMHISRCSSDS